MGNEKRSHDGNRGWTNGGRTCFAKGLLLVVSLGVVFIGVPNAKADLCFRYAKSGGGTLVARGAQLPASGNCQPLALFESGGLIGAANGMICRDNTDGRTIVFHYTYNGWSYAENWVMTG